MFRLRHGCLLRVAHFLQLPRTLNSASASVSAADILPLCAGAETLSSTRQAHAVAITYGYLPSSISIAAALILSYATHRSHLSTLVSLFQGAVPFSRSSFLHNTLIRACTILSIGDYNSGIDEIALFLYNDLSRGGDVFKPDDYTFPFVIKICADFSHVGKGLEVHCRLIKSGFDEDLVVNNTLLYFYGGCGDLCVVKKVFDEMPERDLISWNTCIRVFSDNSRFSDSAFFFKDMFSTSSSDFRPNLVSVVTALPVCAILQDEILASSIHCYVFKVALDSEIKVCNALIDAYGKCGKTEALEGVFYEMVNRNEVTWNSVICGFSYVGHKSKAFDFFRAMIDACVKLNTVTIATVLPVLAELRLFCEGKELHAFCVKNDMVNEVFVVNALIDTYGKWGRSTEASCLFRKTSGKNIVSWNIMIGNYAQNGSESDALRLVMEMQAHGENPNSVTLTNVLPACARLGSLRHGKEIHSRSIRFRSVSDVFVSNALTDMYVKCGSLGLARTVFDTSMKDEVSYNILITGYSETPECCNSIRLFVEMFNFRMNHDTVSYTGVLSACANYSALKEGKQIHAFGTRRLFHRHLSVGNSLLDLYSKCGHIDIARKLFDTMQVRDAASWNTLIMGFGMNGDLNTAVDLFEAMKVDEVQYDPISYLAVLSACSHAGLVRKGKMYFNDMLARNIRPSDMHYACMVDLLGRSGRMGEAVELITSLSTAPGADTWGALLGASRIHGNIELGCWAAEHLLQLKPDHPGYYILLSNMYSEAGRWDQVRRVRELMNLRGVKKNPGCSWVGTGDEVHGFVTGERFDPALLANAM